jgi:AraC-like DNA-binding protein
MEIVAQYIRNNYQQKISMQYLANAVHISQKYLRQKFHSAYGVSPQQYLIDTRMQAAQKLLCDTNYKIKEIAASVGYTSQLDFSNIFKKKTGVSPKEYRMLNTQKEKE